MRGLIDLPKFWRSVRFAQAGVAQLLRRENNARIHLLVTALVVAAGAVLRLSRADWLWVTVAVALVWVTEALNTALETLVDLVSPGYDPRAGAVKDLAAGAVLLAAVAAVVIGLLVFVPVLGRAIKWVD